MSLVRLSEQRLRVGARTPIGAMKDRVILLAPGTRAQDGSDNPPSTFATCWAKVSALQGRELERAQQIVQEVSHLVAMPFEQGITENMVVQYGSRYFLIQYIQDPDESKEELQLYCIERGQNASGAADSTKRQRKMSDDAVNVEANALAAELNSGYLRLYDGSQPDTADTEISTQHLLAELRFGAIAFAAADAGLITANPITGDSDANASGTATWFRCFKSDGITPVMDGSVGTSHSDLNLNSTAIQIHAEVRVTSFTHIVTK